MFELLAMICIDGLCQERLLPAPASQTEAACLASAPRAADWAAAQGHKLRERPWECLNIPESEILPVCPWQAVWSATEVLGNVAATISGGTKDGLSEVEVPPERTALSPDEALRALVSPVILFLLV